MFHERYLGCCASKASGEASAHTSCFPCLSLHPVQWSRSPWPSHGASLPPPALWSIVARLPCLHSPAFAALQISLLSNPCMTGASLKIHHIQITLISFTLFIYFHRISAPTFPCSPIPLCHDEELKQSLPLNQYTAYILFSSICMCFISFFCSSSTCYVKGALMKENSALIINL